MKYTTILCTILFFISCKGQKKSQTTEVDIETMRKEVIGKDVQLVDVRTVEEYNAGHIDDAINIDITNKETFKQKAAALDTTKAIYIYCQKGGRSKRASRTLESLGFIEVYDFSGGWHAWSKE